MIPVNTNEWDGKSMRSVCPTGSYTLEVPELASEDDENGRVFSFWIPKRSLLLQLSSYSRLDGAQVSAAERLDALLKRQPLTGVGVESSLIVKCPDFASAKGVDDEGCVWIYAYAVWDDLALMISVSGKEHEFAESGNWAIASVRTIRRSTTDQ